MNKIGAFAAGFVDDVVGIGDDIGVIPGGSSEGAGSGIAGEGVVERVAGGGECRSAGEGDLLQMIPEGEADGALNKIGAFAAGFVDLITGGIHHIGVITAATGHRVVAAAPINGVVAAVACECVGEAVSDGVDIARTRQGDVFNVVACGVTNGALDQIGAGTVRFGNHITG